MASLWHPFDTSKFYELDQDGNIRISDGDKFGIFTTDARYISGEIRECDPQLCVWVGNNPDPDDSVADSHLSQGAD